MKWITRVALLGGLAYLVVQLPKILDMGLNLYLAEGKLHMLVLFGLAGLAFIGFLASRN